jgi:ribose/xylose/arabinose/galactoside ABC-type transport system permease subunit
MSQLSGTSEEAEVNAEPESEPPTPRRGRRADAGGFRLSTNVASSLTFIVFVLVFVGYSFWLGDLFTSADQRLLDVHQNVPLLLVALGLTVCLVCGQFDLSVGGMATLVCYLTVGLVVNQDWPFPVVLLVAFGAGVVGGALNAFLVVGLRVNAFIATLGTGAIFGGLSTVYSGGTQLSPVAGGPELPSWFSGTGSFGSYQTKVPEPLTWLLLLGLLAVLSFVLSERIPAGKQRQWWAGILVLDVIVVVLLLTELNGFIAAMPWTVVFLIVVAMVLWTTLRYTTYGRYLYATGGNAEAARLSGVKVERMRSSAFVISGLLSATAGVVLAAIQGSASPDIGAGFLLPAFAAAFLATVLLSNGRFHVWGTIIGGVFLIWVSQGLVIGGVPFTWTGVINGVVLVAAVSLSTALRRGERR